MPLDLRATAAFDVLEAAAGTSDEYTFRGSGVSSEAGEMLFALDAHNRRHLLLPLGETKVVEDIRSAGVQIVGIELDIGGLPTPFADIRCLRPELNDVFDMFAEDVLQTAEGSAHPSAAAAATLERWRNLLESMSGNMLSQRRLAGLIAELLVLEIVLETVSGSSLKAWTGPSGHRHDIVVPGLSIEVKSTTATSGREVTVHGLEQLTPLPDKDLRLGLVRLIPDPEGSIALPSVVQRLIAAGASAADLQAQIASVGIAPADFEHYRSMAFSLAGIEVYDPTREAFPRLTTDSLVKDLPAGVDDLTYVADLDFVGEGVGGSDDLIKLLQDMNEAV